MEEQGTYLIPNPIGGSHHHQSTTTNSSPSEDFLSHLLRTPQPHSLEDLFELGDSAGSLTQQAAGIAMQDSVGEFAGSLTQRSPTSAAGYTIPPSTADDMEVNTAGQPVPHPVVGLAGPTTAATTRAAEMLHEQGARPGLGPPQLCPVGDPDGFTGMACLAQPDPYSAATADRGSNAVGVGLPQAQPGTGRVSCKRKKGPISRTSAGRSKVPEFSFVESHAGRDQLDPYSHHDIDTKIKPPLGSTETADIFHWLKQESECHNLITNNVNLTAAMNDQVRPNAVRSYVTGMRMPSKFDKNSDWEEIDYKFVRDERDSTEDDLGFLSLCIRLPDGIIRTLRFVRDDGKVFYMREYLPTGGWGIDLFLLEKGLFFREVFTTANEVPGVPTPRPANNKRGKTTTVNHRIRRGFDTVDGESPVWKHFIKVYDKHPEEKGSEVVYAVCCECHGMLKAGNGHGTTSLSRHRSKPHQASTSSSQSQGTNLSGGQLS